MILVSTDALLKGLGCNMTEKSQAKLFPEECLRELSTRVLQDLKALVLLNGAIQNHKDLLHPEMLLKCLQRGSVDLNVIGALLSKTQDRRFAKVVEFCRASKCKSPVPSRILALAARIGQSTYDADFKSFGIKITELPQGDEKKITSSRRLLRGSVFFKNRVLFGCNWRADIISCIGLGFANPSEIKRRLHCSYETAHRVFNDYTLFQQAIVD
jgi:hypothetical protein